MVSAIANRRLHPHAVAPFSVADPYLDHQSVDHHRQALLSARLVGLRLLDCLRMMRKMLRELDLEITWAFPLLWLDFAVCSCMGDVFTIFERYHFQGHQLDKVWR